MPRNLTHQGKSLLLVLLLVACWWTLPMLFKHWTRSAFQEFQAPAWTALSYLGDLQDFWAYRLRSKNELIEAGVHLSRQQAAYSLRNQQMDALQEELARLERWLSLPALPEHRYAVARVVRRDLNNWQQTLLVRKGAIHGIARGQAVVHVGGVVGRVREVHAYTAIVELISSPDFRTAAHFEGDLRPVEYQGGLNPALAAPRGVVRNAPADLRIPAQGGMRLVSSRLGGVFPDGLTLGHVDRLETGPDGLFQTGVVLLDARLLALREVAVLIPLAAEAPAEGRRP
jgi:rod shape-determining protein MreC